MLNREKIKNFLLKRYYKDLSEKRQLTSVTFEILNACNFKCVHCYNQNLKLFAIDKDLFFSIVDQLVELGCKKITLTGGETTMHPHFKEFYKYCFDKGLEITLYTNGYFLNKYLDFLNEFPPEKIEISLYGVSDETYQKVCKIKDGFTQVDANIKETIKRGLPLQLKTVVMQQNCDDFDQMLAYCQSLNIKFKFDINILNSKDNSNKQTENKLKDTQFEKVMNEVRRLKTENWISYLTRENMSSDSDLLYSCGAGRISLFINCYGGVRLCNFAGFSEENAKDKPIKIIWDDFKKYLNLKKDKNSECYNCTYKKFCAICPVVSYTEHKTDGKVILPVKQNCREAQFIYNSVKNAKTK